MAGGTKCYKVKKMADGTLHREVVSYSPKHADPADVAVAKLTSNPPKSAIVRFHEITEVEQRVSKAAQAEPAPLALDAPTGTGKTRPATEIVGLLWERVDLLERTIYALHAVLCSESALLQGENKPSITAVVDELQGKYFER